MNHMTSVGFALAALELVPGSPSDLNRLLLERWVWTSLVEGERPLGGNDLADYLYAMVDPARVAYWTDLIGQGVSRGTYRPVLLSDSDYPGRLKSLWDAPPVLFLKTGQSVPTHAEPSVAIVGGRETTPEVLRDTFAVAASLAAKGARVISGLAAGVDTAAHEGALSVHGATTAVLGTGIERVFPEQNRDLAERIANQGVLVSQFAPAAPRTGTTFLRRNHVIVGAAGMTLIMDGRDRSGSQYAVEQAVNYGRPVLMWAPAMADEPWASELVGRGKAQFVKSAEEVAEGLARSIS